MKCKTRVGFSLSYAACVERVATVSAGLNVRETKATHPNVHMTNLTSRAGVNPAPTGVSFGLPPPCLHSKHQQTLVINTRQYIHPYDEPHVPGRGKHCHYGRICQLISTAIGLQAALKNFCW